jgi:hypothetical protein
MEFLFFCEKHKFQAVITKVNEIRNCTSCKISNRLMTGLPEQDYLVRFGIVYAFWHTFTRSLGKLVWRIIEILIYKAYTQHFYKSHSYFPYRTLIPYYNTSYVIYGLPTKSVLPQDRTRFSPSLLREYNNNPVITTNSTNFIFTSPGNTLRNVCTHLIGILLDTFCLM